MEKLIPDTEYELEPQEGPAPPHWIIADSVRITHR